MWPMKKFIRTHTSVMSKQFFSILSTTVWLQTIISANTDLCDQEVCGSIVSKCTLIQSCACEYKDLSCYKECISCMGKKHFEECCSCVDLCPQLDNGNELLSLSQKSHVEDFEGVPELFDILVSSPADSLEYSWYIFTFPIDLKNAMAKKNWETNANHGTVNCTVVYFDNCISWNKCRQSCRSTGASGYRWFHDGCCECVGSTCLNYGVNESRCRHCPEEDDEDEFDHILDRDNVENDDNVYVYELFDGNILDNST